MLQPYLFGSETDSGLSATFLNWATVLQSIAAAAAPKGVER